MYEEQATLKRFSMFFLHAYHMCVKYNNSLVLHLDAYYKVSGVLHHSKQTSGTMNMKCVVSKLDCWLDGRVENASCCPVVCKVLRRQ